MEEEIIETLVVAFTFQLKEGFHTIFKVRSSWRSGLNAFYNVKNDQFRLLQIELGSDAGEKKSKNSHKYLNYGPVRN